MSNDKKILFQISDLWKSEIANDFLTFGNEEIKNALAQRAENQAKIRAEVLLGIMDRMSSKNKELLRNLQEIRDREKKVKKLLEKFTRAFEYFKATGNPLPFAACWDGFPDNFTEVSQLMLSTSYNTRDWCNALEINANDLPVEAFIIPQDFSTKKK